MCYPVKCHVCGKTTWAGCGQHIDSVRRVVPTAQWCPGHQDDEQSSSTGFLSKLFSR